MLYAAMLQQHVAMAATVACSMHAEEAQKHTKRPNITHHPIIGHTSLKKP